MFQKYLNDNQVKGKNYFSATPKIRYGFIHSLNVLFQLGKNHAFKGLKEVREKIDSSYQPD